MASADDSAALHDLSRFKAELRIYISCFQAEAAQCPRCPCQPRLKENKLYLQPGQYRQATRALLPEVSIQRAVLDSFGNMLVGDLFQSG